MSILVNNVGLDAFDPLRNISSKQIADLVNVNVLTTTQMSALLLHQLRQRKKKSAIINVGSFAGVIPTYYWSVYGGTKAFVNCFSEVLNMEEPNIDVMCLNPNEVQTNMTF